MANNIILLIDRSGSMSDILDATHKGLAGFLEMQNQDDEISVFMFDHELSTDCVRKPVKQIGKIVIEPRGSTAMFDAMCAVIDNMGVEFSKTNYGGNVVFVVVTDGMENSSREFNYQDVEKRISHQENNYGWKFVYLGANQDAIATASKIGIAKNSSLTYGTTKLEVSNAYKALASVVGAYSDTGTLRSFTSEERELALDK